MGKINAVDLLAGDPIFGGWGTQRFQNIAFVAPPSGVVPPTLMGGILVHKWTPIGLTVMVYDPEDRTRDYFPGDLFDTGVNVSAAGTWSGNIAGRASSIGVTSIVSTKRGADLANIPAPPGLVTEERKGSYNVSLQFTQRLTDFNDEQGVEAWYSLALTPWFKVTASTQLVNPAAGDRAPALLAGLRANLAF